MKEDQAISIKQAEECLLVLGPAGQKGGANYPGADALQGDSSLLLHPLHEVQLLMEILLPAQLLRDMQLAHDQLRLQPTDVALQGLNQLALLG